MDYDRNPIQVFTMYTFEEMKEFQRSHFRGTRLRFTVNAILFAGLLLLAVYLRFHFGPSFDPLMLILGAGLAFTVLCVLFYSMVFYSRKQYENGTKISRNGEHYTFRNHDFTSSTEQGDYTGQNSMHYTILHSVRETESAFYLYQNRMMAYIVCKQGFQSGSPNELRALLQGNVPPNQYIIVGINDRDKHKIILPLILGVLIVVSVVVVVFL